MNVHAEKELSDIVRKGNVIECNVERKNVIFGNAWRENVILKNVRRRNIKKIVNQRYVREGSARKNENLRNVSLRILREENVNKNVSLRNVRKGSVKKIINQRNVSLRNVRKGSVNKIVNQRIVSLRNVRKENAKNVNQRNLNQGNMHKNARLWNVKTEIVTPRNVRMENVKLGLDTRHLLFLLLLVGGGGAVRITQLEVPKLALAGDDVHLRCHYQEDGDGGGLYTLKWYKDQQEIFRHQPGISLAATSARCPLDLPYHVPGVTVDCWASTERQVVLKDVSIASSGTYKCEVIGDHPKFRKEIKGSHLTVFNEMLLPPDLTQGTEDDLSSSSPNTVSASSTSTFSCMTRNTEYTPALSWIINGRPANQSWVRQVGGKESTLVVPVRGEYFPGGVMRVDCLANLGEQHSQAAHLKLRHQDHLSAQEYQYSAALSGQKTGVGFLLVVVILPVVLLWSPNPWR